MFCQFLVDLTRGLYSQTSNLESVVELMCNLVSLEAKWLGEVRHARKYLFPHFVKATLLLEAKIGSTGMSKGFVWLTSILREFSTIFG